jgi:hypothetical protein
MASSAPILTQSAGPSQFRAATSKAIATRRVGTFCTLDATERGGTWFLAGSQLLPVNSAPSAGHAT